MKGYSVKIPIARIIGEDQETIQEVQRILINRHDWSDIDQRDLSRWRSYPKYYCIGPYSIESVLAYKHMDYPSAIITYNTSDYNSFDLIKQQLSDIIMAISDGLLILLAFNQGTHDQRQVTYEQGLELAIQHSILFLEITQLTELNIDSFCSIVEYCVRNYPMSERFSQAQKVNLQQTYMITNKIAKLHKIYNNIYQNIYKIINRAHPLPPNPSNHHSKILPAQQITKFLPIEISSKNSPSTQLKSHIKW